MRTTGFVLVPAIRAAVCSPLVFLWLALCVVLYSCVSFTCTVSLPAGGSNRKLVACRSACSCTVHTLLQIVLLVSRQSVFGLREEEPKEPGGPKRMKSRHEAIPD